MSLGSDSDSDARLFELAREGEADAFEALVRRHYRTLFTIALAILGNRMDAEDACHDGLVQSLAKWETCREPDRVGNWLAQVVRNRARTLARARRVRRAEALEGRAIADGSDSAQAVSRAELGGLLEAALTRLTPIQREVMVLFEVDDWSHERIAGFLEISVGMSRQHLFNARRTLRSQLDLEPLREYLNG